MTDDARRASDARFRARRAELSDALAALLGPHDASAPVADADHAAALAAEARAAYRAAEQEGWALVRHEWPREAVGAVVALLHAVNERVEARPVWLVVPGREPQAISLPSDAVLDNPMGFAALADFELVLLDHGVPGGITLTGHAHVLGSATDAWELEAWGAEPWLSAVTRAVRDERASGDA